MRQNGSRCSHCLRSSNEGARSTNLYPHQPRLWCNDRIVPIKAALMRVIMAAFFVTGQEVLFFPGKFSFVSESIDWVQFLFDHLLVGKCLQSQLITEVAKDDSEICNR